MPSWRIHKILAKLCKIPEETIDWANEFVDKNPVAHDVGRVIVDGQWIPEILLHLAELVYENYGRDALKAVLHHHIIGYARTLLEGGKYGYMIKHRTARERVRAISEVLGFVNKVFENIENIPCCHSEIAKILTEVARELRPCTLEGVKILASCTGPWGKEFSERLVEEEVNRRIGSHPQNLNLQLLPSASP